MRQRAHHRIRREAAERAQGAELHGIAEVFEQRPVRGPLAIGDDAIDHLDAAGRADPAWRALAAGFDSAELHGKSRLFGHVDGVVEHHDAAVADQAVGLGEGLVVERQVEQRAGKIGAERATDLYGADLTPGRGAAADVLDQFAERDAECRLVKTADI